ncbi:MAG: polymer-forming cytoskeletal protein [Proteobacteria bacterium]|nr:polymer-forming cytoskeletal protein [Pseudomonadota bacterium]
MFPAKSAARAKHKATKDNAHDEIQNAASKTDRKAAMQKQKLKLKKNIKKNKSQLKSSNHSYDGVTIIAEGCNFEGKLYCRGVSRIGGKVNGEIIAEGTLIIEKDAHILADIQSRNVVIHGFVKGKILAYNKAELLSTSHLEGAIITPSLLVEEGTTINASISMDVNQVSDFDSEKKPTTSAEPTTQNVDDEENKVEVLKRHSEFRKKRG